MSCTMPATPRSRLWTDAILAGGRPASACGARGSQMSKGFLQRSVMAAWKRADKDVKV